MRKNFGKQKGWPDNLKGIWSLSAAWIPRNYSLLAALKTVRQEVRRLKQVFSERFIVSPSHEALLPNVSIDNVTAMSRHFS